MKIMKTLKIKCFNYLCLDISCARGKIDGLQFFLMSGCYFISKELSVVRGEVGNYQ